MRGRLAPDGTASVVSLGKPQTYILKGPRRSVILQKDETHILKDGDQIALRKNHKTLLRRAVHCLCAAR